MIADSQPDYFFTTCDENGNYTQNSLYQTNLHQLLSDLTAQASQTDFYNTTIGESPDRVYGTFYCRRDITPEFCDDCVRAAAQMIVTVPDVKRLAASWSPPKMWRVTSLVNNCTVRKRELPSGWLWGNTLRRSSQYWSHYDLERETRERDKLFLVSENVPAE